jgi:hypothetical protein
MVAIMKVWHAASFAERTAFLAITRDNSREADDLAKVGPLMGRLQAALDRVLVN